jgi:hypothetical protein
MAFGSRAFWKWEHVHENSGRPLRCYARLGRAVDHQDITALGYSR